MDEYRALLDRVLTRFRALSRDIAAHLSDDVPEEANFKLAFKDYFDAFGRFYNATYNDWLAWRTNTEEARTFDVGLDDWRARYAAISGLEPSNPSESEGDPWRPLRLLGWGALGVGALFGVGWLVASVVKGAGTFKPSLTIGAPPIDKLVYVAVQYTDGHIDHEWVWKSALKKLDRRPYFYKWWRINPADQ